jgi:hypothetical protein
MSKKDERIFYVYAFLRSKNSTNGKKGSPYYVGKGNGNRAWSNTGRQAKKPTDAGSIVLLRQGLTEKEAFEWEIFYINRYGRLDQGTGILRNKTDGGEGVAGFDFSNERNNFYGKKHSEATKSKYSATRMGADNAHYGKKHSARARGIMAARHAKYLYELIDSEGEVYMTESLRDFCRQYSLDRRSLARLLGGERDFYKDWKIRVAETLR